MAAGSKLIKGAWGFVRDISKPDTRKSLEAVQKRRRAGTPGPTAEELEALLKASEEGLPPGPPATATAPEITPDGTPAPVAAPGEAVTAPVTKTPTKEEAASIAQDLIDQVDAPPPTDKRTYNRNINIQRHHEGTTASSDPSIQMGQMTSADDMAKLLDLAANTLKMGEAPRPHETVRGLATPDRIKELIPFMTGEETGLLRDSQLVVASDWLAVLGNDISALVARVADGDATPVLLLEVDEKIAAFATLQHFIQGQKKEVARSLSAMRIAGDSRRSGTVTEIMGALSELGGSKEGAIARAKSLHARIQKAGDGDMDVAAAVSKGIQSKWRTGVGMIIEMWKNNVLSGAPTQLVNIVGNAVNNVNEAIFIKPIAGAFGSAERKIFGTEDVVTLTEATVSAVSTWAAFRDGSKMAWVALVTKESKFAGGSSKLDLPGGPGPTKTEEALSEVGFNPTVAKWIGEAFTGSFRALGAMDEWSRAIAYRPELAGLATRDGLAKGKTGKELVDHIAALVEDPPDAMHEAALKAAQRMTYTLPADDLSYGFDLVLETGNKWVAKFPLIAGALLPFRRTPVNIAERVFEISGVGNLVLSKWHKEVAAGGARRRLALTRLGWGTFMTTGFYMMYANGDITGDGPKDPALRRQLEKTGWRPNAIRHGGKYYSVKRLQPFTTALFGYASIMDRAKYAKTKKEWDDLVLEATIYLGANTMEATYMKNLNQFLDVFDNPAAGKRILASTIGGLVPYSGALKTVKDAMDVENRRTGVRDRQRPQGLGEMIRNGFYSRTPGLSEDLRPARYWDGSLVLPDVSTPVHAMSPFKVGKEAAHDPVNAELIRQGVGLNEPSPVMSYGRISFSLMHFDDGLGLVYDEYVKVVGRLRREYLADIIGSPEYKKAGEAMSGEGDGPGSLRAEMLKNAANRARRDAAGIFMDKRLMPALREIKERDPDLLAPIAKFFGMDGTSLSAFLDMAGNKELPGNIQKLLTIRGAGDTGALPLPPHMSEKTGPKF